MKVVQKLCLTFLTVVLFFSTYGWYTEIQKLELLNNQALNKEFVYWLTLSETVDEKRINDLIELSDKYEVDLIKEVITDKENNYFLYGDFTNIQDFLYNQSLPDFHDITKFVSYSSTDGSMYVLDKEKNYNVYSINYLSELGSLRGRINLSSNDEMNIYQFEEEFKSKFPSDFISNYKIESEVSDQSNHFFDFYMNEMIVLSSLIFIISCFIVSKEVEKISILRLQGFSFFKIIVILFFKDFCMSLLLSSMVCTGLFITFFHSINKFNINIVFLLAKLIMIQVVICLIILILLTLFMNLSNKKPLLRKQKIHKLCMNISFGLRLLLIFIIVPQILPIMSQLNDLTTYIHTVNEYSNIVNNYSVCEYINQYGEMSIEQEQAMKDDYSYFNDKGILYMGRAYDPTSSIHDNLTINENVLKMFWEEKTKDIDSVCTMNDSQEVKRIASEGNFSFKKIDNRKILDLSYLIRPYPTTIMPNYIDENCIIFVPSLDKTRNVNFGNGSFFLKGEPDEINSDLEKLGYKDKIIAISLKDKVSSIIHMLTISNIVPIVKLVVYLFVLSILSISTLMFYHYSYENKNKILRTLGYSMYKIYRWIYLEVLCTGILSLVITHVLSPALIAFMGGYMILDFVIFSIYSIIFSKKMLKGGISL